MRRTVLLLASMALAVLFSSVLILGTAIHPAAAQAAPAKPNIVFILTDDMRKDDLKYMPKTRRLLGAGGMTFSNAYVTNPLCCPARATIMRGQYAHNTGVWVNRNVPGPGAGLRAYRANGHEADNVATRLDGAGYETALFGKYINGYDEFTVPPGWDRWFGALTEGADYYDYDVSDNGVRRHFGSGEEHYMTDVLSREARSFISESAMEGKPFFAYIAQSAPHGPATPAPRHEHTHDGLKAPRSPSFNEKDVSDKPWWIRKQARLKSGAVARINRRHENRAESLRAVDEMVEGLVGELVKSGQLDNTYIFFTSDNGWHHGEHRIPFGKVRPYEEDIRVPLLVRGPGVAAGSITNKLVLNTDYLPTFTNLAGAQTPSYVDGRSMRPVLRGGGSSWRSAILLEGRKTPEGGLTRAYYGIRTSTGVKRKYVEYAGGARELYYLGSDPYELANKYRAASPPNALAARLRALKNCAGAGCRAAENRR